MSLCTVYLLCVYLSDGGKTNVWWIKIYMGEEHLRMKRYFIFMCNSNKFEFSNINIGNFNMEKVIH